MNNVDTFTALDKALHDNGPAAALAVLRTELEAASDYPGVFYAKLMADRLRLGVSPTPTRPAQELPDSVHAEYESAIRAAGRTAGEMCLRAGDISRAWGFYRMLGEPEPVRQALDSYVPKEDEDFSPILDIALQQGVHPARGFDLILDRNGICSAISAVGAFEQSLPPDVKRYCVARLVGALHDQLAANLRSTIAAHEEKEPSSDATVGELIQGRDWLFGDDCYYIDLSHLSSVVQLSLDLPPGPELELARQLCAFGAKLPDKYGSAGAVPFDRGYEDYGAFLAVIAGHDVETHLARFRTAVKEADGNTYPAEVLINLLLKLGRDREALAVARQHLLHADDRQLVCPGAIELAYRSGDFNAMAEIAKERGDRVHYLAARLEVVRTRP